MASCCHDKCVYEQSMKGSKGGRQRNERWARNWFLGTKIETNKKECNCCVTKRVNPGMFWEKVMISENKMWFNEKWIFNISTKKCASGQTSLSFGIDIVRPLKIGIHLWIFIARDVIRRFAIYLPTTSIFHQCQQLSNSL